MGGETAAHTTGNFQRHLMDIKLFLLGITVLEIAEWGHSYPFSVLPMAGGDKMPRHCLCSCWVVAVSAKNDEVSGIIDIATQIHCSRLLQC